MDEGVWVRIPTFNPGEEQKKKFTQLLEKLKEYRKASYIIFDLRGNGGGNTDWERPILRNLYGDSFLKALGQNHLYNLPWVKRLRASGGNFSYLKTSMSEQACTLFAKARENGDDFYTETRDIFDETKNLYSNKDKVRSFPRTYLLTDRKCGSTCWLFVREMLQMPKVTQIGETTRAQSLYSEARFIALPSGFAELYFPMQQRISPIEDINRPFIPKHKYKGNWQDEEELIVWVMKVVRSN